MTSLKITKDLPLPTNTVTQKLAWLGTTGSGKTYGASKLAEEFWRIGAQFVVLDPVGVWYGLRLAKDGKKPSKIDIPIFGGFHGDVPLESTAGELLANLVVDKGLSCIIDVSQFESDAEKARFAKDFANKFFFRKKAAPSAVHLFLEECQEFVPQNPQRGEEQMLHAFVRMQKLGRNFGIGSSYITQRPQEVNKKALNMAQTLFVFRVTGTHERAAIEKWIEDRPLDQSIAKDLPKIPTGDCHVWSPEFLKVSDMVHISEKETFNASATPEVGAAAKARQLAPIDLEKVRNEMAATIEKAKSEDPKELKKKIAVLERQVGKPSTPTTADPKATENAVAKALQARDREWQAKIDVGGREIQRLGKILTQIARLAGAEQTSMVIVGPDKPIHVSLPAVTKRDQPQDRTTTAPKEAPVVDGDFRPSRSQQSILNALAWLEGVGVEEADKTQVALLSDQSPTSGGYFNNLGTLRSAGLIEYPRASMLVLTAAGRDAARSDDTPATSEELHEQLFKKLSASQVALLKTLIRVYPEPISKNDLALQAEQDLGKPISPTSGGYFNNLGYLRSLKIIDYPSPGMVVAQKVLFLS